MAAGKAKKYRGLLRMPNTTKLSEKSKIIWVGSVEGVNDSPRMYPRSLRDAFPQDYTNPIEAPPSKISTHDVFIGGLAIMVWACMILFFIKE